MMGATYQQLRQAILERKQVSCIYQGLPRMICPHVIGRKRGKEQVLGFQFAGESSKGLPPGGMWRCMPVDGISSVVLIDGPWHTGDGHSQDQTCVDEIDVEIDY